MAQNEYLYTATDTEGLVKVGWSTNPANRIYYLNKYQYAGRSNWRLDHSVKTPNAEYVESIALKTLAKRYGRPSGLVSGDGSCPREAFKADIEHARNLINKLSRDFTPR